MKWWKRLWPWREPTEQEMRCKALLDHILPEALRRIEAGEIDNGPSAYDEPLYLYRWTILSFRKTFVYWDDRWDLSRVEIRDPISGRTEWLTLDYKSMQRIYEFGKRVEAIEARRKSLRETEYVYKSLTQ